MADIKKYISLDNLTKYDELLKAKMATDDAAILDSATGYVDQELVEVNKAIEAAQAQADKGVGDAATAQAAAEAAQATADAAAEAIAAINGEDGTDGILAQAKAFAEEEDAKLQESIDGVSEKVDTLIGSDSDKSVRTIANEELAKQLIADGAKEALDTLTEIAAWIQSHPDDASAMNTAIEALQTKTTLGNDADSKEYATVKAYVEAMIAAEVTRANGADDALKSELEGAIADAIEDALETAAEDASGKADAVSEALADYEEAHAEDYTNAQIDEAIKVNTDAIAKLDETYATDAELANAIAGEVARADGKYADKATTLSGYSITDAYTQDEVNALIAEFEECKPEDIVALFPTTSAQN